jgi:transcriptional regulator with XRE-family HTH domain
MLDDEGIRQVLWARTHQRGRKGLVGEFAREIGVTQAFLANIVRGVNRPSDRVLAALGYKRVTGYVPIDGDTA